MESLLLPPPTTGEGERWWVINWGLYLHLPPCSFPSSEKKDNCPRQTRHTRLSHFAKNIFFFKKTRITLFNDLRRRISKGKKIAINSNKSRWLISKVAHLSLWFQNGVWPPFLYNKGGHIMGKVSHWSRKSVARCYDFRMGSDSLLHLWRRQVPPDRN